MPIPSGERIRVKPNFMVFLGHASNGVIHGGGAYTLHEEVEPPCACKARPHTSVCPVVRFQQGTMRGDILLRDGEGNVILSRAGEPLRVRAEMLDVIMLAEGDPVPVLQNAGGIDALPNG